MWPAWRFGPNGESAIFNHEGEVPYGWSRKPGEDYVAKESPVLDRAAIEAELVAAGIVPHPAWSAAYMKEVLNDGSTSR